MKHWDHEKYYGLLINQFMISSTIYRKDKSNWIYKQTNIRNKWLYLTHVHTYAWVLCYFQCQLTAVGWETEELAVVGGKEFDWTPGKDWLSHTQTQPSPD